MITSLLFSIIVLSTKDIALTLANDISFWLTCDCRGFFASLSR